MITHEIVSPLRRLLLIPVAVFGFLAGVGPFLDASSFESQVFDTFRSFAPLKVWGALFLIVALLAFVTLARPFVISYLATYGLLIGLATFWLVVLIWARWVDGVPVSSTAFGLWLFIVTSAGITVSVPIATALDSRTLLPPLPEA